MQLSLQCDCFKHLYHIENHSFLTGFCKSNIFLHTTGSASLYAFLWIRQHSLREEAILQHLLTPFLEWYVSANIRRK